MRVEADDPREAWGILNPGGVRSLDGAMHLFPRLIAEGNYSRIDHATVRYDGEDPVGANRLGMALEPRELYELSPAGGGVEDPRVVHVPLIACYVMTYTAFLPFDPRVAVAVSDDLRTWRRLGLLHFEAARDVPDLNAAGNKDATFFPEPVLDPEGVRSLAILHRPTTRICIDVNDGEAKVKKPPCGQETRENIWISYVALENVLTDIANLTTVRRHERVMAPEQAWEELKVGAGTPPIRLPYGWVVPYHAVATRDDHTRYCMGIAILDLERPSNVLYRTPAPIMEPATDYERSGLVSDVIFPTASDLRADGRLDVYYGAADRSIAVARISLPKELPAVSRAVPEPSLP